MENGRLGRCPSSSSRRALGSTKSTARPWIGRGLLLLLFAGCQRVSKTSHLCDAHWKEPWIKELGFSEGRIQSSDALLEISQGQWEGCLQSEVYTTEMLNLIERTQPDFCAPSGESLRQVAFRMIEFLNRTVLRLSERLAVADISIHRNESKELSRNSSTNSIQDGPHWDLLYRLNRSSLQRKKFGKSRLQYVTTGDNETDEDFSPREVAQANLLSDVSKNMVSSIGLFTHAVPIKCLLTGLLECSPMMSQKLTIDDSSATVLHHSLRTGWQIKRLNDTAHLRLL